MAITDIISQTQGISTAGRATDKSYGASKDQFLKLLMAQLKNQDPLSAPDADKMAEQITQFGQLEQLINLNTSMTGLASTQAVNSKGQAVGMIGKTVEVQGNGLEVSAASKGNVGFYLPQPCETVEVQVLDTLGRVVRTIDYSEQKAGSSFYAFDGKADDGSMLSNGVYKLKVSGKSVNGLPVQASPIIRGQVSGVEFSGNNPIVRVGGQSFTMDEVISVTGS